MIKLGEQRINPLNIAKYYPDLDISIMFDLLTGARIEVTFKSKSERDDMLKLLDKFLVDFDDGTVILPEINNLPTFILGGQGPTEGPGGISIQ